MLIINANIHTMAASNIERGFIEVKNGIIVQVGDMKNAPSTDSEEVIDLQGRDIYPGFIDAHTHIGMFENGLNFEGDDGNEASEPITPHLRAIDAINPMDACFKEALAAGITTVITGPGSANPIGGQMVAMKTYGNRIDNMIVKAPAAMKFALGENPKSVYHDKEQLPYTRMATAALIRETLKKAQKYLEAKEKAAEDEDFDEPEYDAKLDALIPVLKGELTAHFHAHRADDIFTAIRLAKEFSLKYVIIHATEGHLIADELKEENAAVFSGPFLCDRSKPELVNLTPKTPGILSAQGVKATIVTDHPVIPIQYLPLCAGLAVREGMQSEEAIKAITINAAELCGIDGQVGSIEVGKDADLLVFSEDPLTLSAKPEMVFCHGEMLSF